MFVFFVYSTANRQQSCSREKSTKNLADTAYLWVFIQHHSILPKWLLFHLMYNIIKSVIPPLVKNKISNHKKLFKTLKINPQENWITGSKTWTLKLDPFLIANKNKKKEKLKEKVPFEWLNLTLNGYKVYCKKWFLEWTCWHIWTINPKCDQLINDNFTWMHYFTINILMIQ